MIGTEELQSGVMPPLPYAVLDPFDMAPAQALDLAAQLEIAPDLRIIQDAEAVDHGQATAHFTLRVKRGL